MQDSVVTDSVTDYSTSHAGDSTK